MVSGTLCHRTWGWLLGSVLLRRDWTNFWRKGPQQARRGLGCVDRLTDGRKEGREKERAREMGGWIDGADRGHLPRPRLSSCFVLQRQELVGCGRTRRLGCAGWSFILSSSSVGVGAQRWVRKGGEASLQPLSQLDSLLFLGRQDRWPGALGSWTATRQPGLA